MKQKTVLIIKNNQFHKLVNNLFYKIEDHLNVHYNEIDFDYEIQNYVLTIIFSKRNKIIINRQESLQQVWLATICHGYHFYYRNDQWLCNRSNKNFWKIFKQAFLIQSQKIK